ncbi:MAG: hypothetical protein H3C47_01145, partial [Candidatus Cloacimonetes bacterium]|nr:hypothetical protein [Candidatus Cloacimonadota bacterium]
MLNSWLGKLLGLLFLVSMSFADTRQLAQGWNLVSVPISQPTAVGTWLAGKNLTTVTKIWTYDGGWKSWVPGQTEESGSLFSSFTVNRGYWFLLSSAASYEFSPSDAALQPLELSATGWTMVGFGNQTPLSFETQVLHQNHIDPNHEPGNIAKVWGYEAVGGAGWKQYTNATTNTTTTMNPGMAHWFLVQNISGKTVTNENRMTITPSGAAGSAALVIGGATSLTPPQVSLSVSTIPGFTGVGSASSTGACTASTSGVYARAFSLAGVQISDDELSKVCLTSPATYEVGFSSAKKTWLTTNSDVANNLVIKVQLSGGQSVKTIVADEFKGKNINSISRTEDKTADAGSTLGVAMASVELAKKAGVPTDRFKLGEANSGMNMALESIKTISQKKDIELKGFTEAINAAAKDPNSVMGQMASRITSFNANATASTTAAADNVVKLLTGAPGTGISSTVLNSALSVGSKGMELFANQAKSSDRGIASTGTNATKLSSLGTKLMAATPSDTALINTADIITRSLGMATVTSNDKVLGGLLKGNLEKALGKLDVNSLSGSGTDAVTRAMDIAGEALALPSALVSNLAQNREAASQFAGLVGQSNVLLKQVERDDKTRTGDKVLEKNSGAASKLSGAKNVFAQMAQNAPDSTALNNMIAAAVGSAAGDSNAGKELFDTIGTIRTAIATGNLRVDFSAVASAAVQNSGDIQQVAILMARNAGDASDAANVLKQFKSVLPESTMGEVLADDRIANEFGLGSRIFVDAGPTQTIKVGSNGQATIVLDGSGTYDPQGSSNLSYVWSRVSADGSTLSTVSTRIVTSVQISGLPTNGREIRTYRLAVTDTVNKRKAEADVQFVFQSNVPPVLLAPQYLSVQANETFFVDLSQSFDPESFATLTFSASGDGLTVENQTEFANSGFLMARYATEGRKSVVVGASKADGASTTQAVTIRVEGALPPYADAGFDIVVGTAEVNSGFVQMDNWSFSVQGNPLSYEWSPANHFRSTQANAGATSEFPIFTTTAAGTYTVNLVVTDTVTQAKSSDSAVVIVRRGQPPYADAGFAQVVRGTGTQNVTLDGTFSFSFTNDEPTYEWSGPEGVIGTQSTVTTAINLDLYTSRTKLTYKLKVTDANGSSEATVDVFVVPQASAAAPVVIVERFPALREYSPGDSIFLDASQSFSPTGGALKYSWTVQGTGLEVSDTTQSYVSMSIPASFTGTQVPVVLEVTAGLSSKTRREFNLAVVSRQVPPVAVASPNFVFLEDVANGANPRPPIRVSCFDSFSFTGNDSDLTCSWRLNSTNVVIAEGNSTDKVIGLRAKAGLTDDATATVTLTVKDTSSGLTATDTVFVNLKAFRAQGALPMFVDAHIEQMFENGRAYPAMNPNRMNEFTFFDFGGSQLEKKQLTLFGFVENPNRAFDAEGASATVTAALYQLSGNQKGMKIEDVTVMADGFGTFTDFSIDSHNLSTATSMQLLELVASPVGGNAPSRILTYVVRINNMVQNQGGNLSGLEARPEITFLDRTLTKPALQIGGRFATPRVMAMVDASKSVNPSGLPLEYIWRYRWLDNRPQEPGIFFNGFGTPMVSFDVPLPTTSPRSLEIQLSVKDAITGSVSPIRAVTLIDLLQSNDVPPVAMAGFIPKELFLGPNQNEIQLFLDGSLSYSASGNALRVTWTHEFGFGVFGNAGSRTSSSATTKATAFLVEGPHRFRLTVVDATNDKRRSEEFFTVDVRKPLVINPDLEFLVDGFADAFPRDAFVNEDIHISGSFFATSTSTLDFTKLKAKVLMDGTEIYSGDGSFISTSFSLSSTGSKIVTVQGWYDFNDDGNYQVMPDKSSIREIFIPITVRKDEVPVAALIRMPSVVVADGQAASIPATFAVAVDPTLLAEENVYIEFFYDLFNMDFNAMPSAPLGGTVTSASGEASVMITGVAPGEYEVYLSAYPVRMVSGVPEFLSDSPAEAFAKIRVIGDEAQIRV